MIEMDKSVGGLTRRTVHFSPRATKDTELAVKGILDGLSNALAR
ncbi:hypothetical protein [Candidatus Accumulibacter sp. ACC003]